MDISHPLPELIRDIAQYIRFQRSLGHGDLSVSDQVLSLTDTWHRPFQSPLVTEPLASAGPVSARIFFVDSEGTFFTGPAGDLLVRILSAMHLSSDQVFICKSVPGAAVRDRIRMHRPLVVVALGEKAARALISDRTPLDRLRGRFHAYEGIPVMPTLHPAQLLENPALKRPVWEDMQQVMARIAEGPP